MIELTDKTGFNVLASPITIADIDGIPFYETEFLPVQPKQFNLPLGRYFIQGGVIQKADSPVMFKKSILPLGHRIRKNPATFPVIWGANPNKCSVLWDEEIILFDLSIKRLPKYCFFHIYFHELGHAHYSGEKACDLFAANKMLENGFNPSQILLAENFCLSDHWPDRKSSVLKEVLNNNSVIA